MYSVKIRTVLDLFEALMPLNPELTLHAMIINQHPTKNGGTIVGLEIAVSHPDKEIIVVLKVDQSQGE